MPLQRLIFLLSFDFIVSDSRCGDNDYNRFPMKLSKAINFLSGTVAHLVPFFRGFSFFLFFLPFVWFQFHFSLHSPAFIFFSWFLFKLFLGIFSCGLHLLLPELLRVIPGDPLRGRRMAAYRKSGSDLVQLTEVNEWVYTRQRGLAVRCERGSRTEAGSESGTGCPDLLPFCSIEHSIFSMTILHLPHSLPDVVCLPSLSPWLVLFTSWFFFQPRLPSGTSFFGNSPHVSHTLVFLT